MEAGDMAGREKAATQPTTNRNSVTLKTFYLDISSL